MISKYDKPHVLFMRFNTFIFPFLPTSCTSATFFHLRGKKPFKGTPTKTINNNKALSCGSLFSQMWQIQWSHTLSCQQIKSELWSGSFWAGLVYGKVSHKLEPSQKCNIMFFVLIGTSRKLSCVEPRSLENRSSLYVLLLSASPRSYLFSEIELLQSNGNHAECCGTSFSHTTTV